MAKRKSEKNGTAIFFKKCKNKAGYTRSTDATTGATRLELLNCTRKTYHFHDLTNWVKRPDQRTNGQTDTHHL